MILGIFIGIILWQLVTLILLMIDKDNDTFKYICLGIPFLIMFSVAELYRKLHIKDKHTYFRCYKILDDEIDKICYYCTKYDYYYTKFPHEDIDKSYRFNAKWHVQNMNKISKRTIKREHIKNWKEYKGE